MEEPYIISKCCKARVSDEAVTEARSPWYVCEECRHSCEVDIMPRKPKSVTHFGIHGYDAEEYNEEFEGE